MADHNWDALHEELSSATTAWTRDELVVLLRDLIREYVVERGLPTGSPAQAGTPDLTGMDFAQLITWLKRNLTVPELGLFQVDGRRVIVDADGPRVLSSGSTSAPPVTSVTIASPGSPVAEAPANPPAPNQAPRAATPVGLPVNVDDDSKSKSTRKLSRGFKGLEFD